jgi:hypothetical protein
VLFPIIVLAFVATTASAKSIVDPQTSFVLELPGPDGTVVCVVLPPEKADTSPECTSLEHGSAFGGTLGQRVVGAAVVRYANNDAWVIVSVTDRSGIGEVSEESIAAIGRDMANSFQAHKFGLISPVGVDPVRSEVVDVHGARGVRYSLNAYADPPPCGT